MTFPLGFRPTLAFTVGEPDTLQYPVWASPKIDGIRCLITDGVAYSRNLKPLRNRHFQSEVAKLSFSLEGLDGEVVVGKTFQETSSAVMSEDGEPAFTFFAFDSFKSSQGWLSRYRSLEAANELSASFTVLTHLWIDSPASLLAYEAHCLSRGYEGVMVRRALSPYKYGRSTAREGYLGKIKRFLDAEAVIVGATPLYRNENEAVVDNLGLTRRAHHAENKLAVDLLGNFVVRPPSCEMTFEVGTGFTALQRRTFWRDRDALIGRTIKYKYLPYGVKDKPRHPVFLGFRDPTDL